MTVSPLGLKSKQLILSEFSRNTLATRKLRSTPSVSFMAAAAGGGSSGAGPGRGPATSGRAGGLPRGRPRRSGCRTGGERESGRQSGRLLLSLFLLVQRSPAWTVRPCWPFLLTVGSQATGAVPPHCVRHLGATGRSRGRGTSPRCTPGKRGGAGTTARGREAGRRRQYGPRGVEWWVIGGRDFPPGFGAGEVGLPTALSRELEDLWCSGATGLSSGS